MLPDWKQLVRAQLAPLRLPPERELEIVEELSLHLEAAYETALAQGLGEEAAQAHALAQISDWRLLESELARAEAPAHRLSRALATEPWIEQKGGLRMEALWQDLRYSLRMLRKNPGFTAVAMLTLALGIGANTAIFSLIDAILFRPLPVQQPEQLMILRRSTQQGPEDRFSYPAYQRFRELSPVFSGVFASSGIMLRNVIFDHPGGHGAGEPEHAGIELVSGNYFSVLGVNPVLGRVLTDADDVVRGGHPVAVISHRYWQRRFGLDPAVLGKTFTLNRANTSFTVIGVTPPRFFGASIEATPDIWIPLAMNPQVSPGDSLLDQPTTSWLHVLARLRPGVIEPQATAQLNVVYQQILRELTMPPEQQRQLSEQRIELMPGSKGLADVREHLSLSLSILMAITGLVLLIACANLANLLLARAATRQQEIAVRLALGAGRLRLIQQLLTESVLLAVLGGALGLCFAYWASDGLMALLNWDLLPMAIKFTPDLRLLAFAGGVCLLSGILFGLAPALRATRLDLNSTLKGSTHSLGGGVTRWSLGQALVIGQVAVSLLLLVGAGLFVRSLQKLQGLELGFNREHVLLVKYDPTTTGYEGAELARLYQRLLERVETLPGVRSASVSMWSLMLDEMEVQRISIPGDTPRPGEERSAYLDLVATRYFDTVGMSLVQGRGFRPQDNEHAPNVGIINQTLAHDFFGQGNPIGRRISLEDGESRPQLEVVGVVKDAKYASLRESPHRMVYRPFLQATQQSDRVIELQVRTEGDPMSLAAAIQREMRLSDQRLSAAVLDVRTLVTQINDSLGEERMTAKLSGLFGLVALILASMGLYGVLSFSVSQRRSEIGLRMALGAQPRDVLKLVVGQGMKLALIGVVIGLAASLALTRIVASLLFGVSVTDPVTLITIALLLMAVVALACYLPARRAAKVDPMVALRHE